MNTSPYMIEENVHFFSNGYELDASFYWPRNKIAADVPVLIICSGFTGLKNIHPARFARFLTQLGYPCFGFDYRGFGKSEGNRKLILLEEQTADIAHAVSFVSKYTKTSNRPIILIGWGMAGGMILEAARLSPQVKALITINGFYDAQRVQKFRRGPKKWKAFLNWLQKENDKATVSGNLPDVDPFYIYPLDTATEEYTDRVLRGISGYDGLMVNVNFANSLLSFAPERRLDHLVDTPILIVHGEKNSLHPIEEAKSLFEKYPGPKTLIWIRNVGHIEWMSDPILDDLMEQIHEWIKGLK